MDFSDFGLGFGLAGNTVGGLVGSIMNYKNQKEEQKFRRDVYYEQMAREDTAVQRRKADLLAAGFNPVLAAGQPAASGVTYNGNETDYQNPDFLANILGVMQQAQAINANELDNKLKAFQLARSMDEFDYDKSLRDVKTNLMKEQLNRNSYYNRVFAPLETQRMRSQADIDALRREIFEYTKEFQKGESEFKKWSNNRYKRFYEALDSDKRMPEYKDLPPILEGSDMLGINEMRSQMEKLDDLFNTEDSGTAGGIFKGFKKILDMLGFGDFSLGNLLMNKLLSPKGKSKKR